MYKNFYFLILLVFFMCLPFFVFGQSTSINPAEGASSVKDSVVEIITKNIRNFVKKSFDDLTKRTEIWRVSARDFFDFRKQMAEGRLLNIARGGEEVGSVEKITARGELFFTKILLGLFSAVTVFYVTFFVVCLTLLFIVWRKIL